MAVTITHTTPADGTFSATGAAAWDANHAVSGLGTMAEQDANNVNITGGSLSGVTGVATSGTNSNITSLTGLTTPLSVAQGGSGTATPSLVAGAKIAVSGSWPNQTIATTGVASSGTNSDITSLTGLTTPLSVAQGGSGTATPSLVAGTNISISGSWPNQTIATSGVLTGLTVGTTPTSGGAAGQIMFDTGSVLQESNNLVWDNTNKYLQVKSDTGAYQLGASSAVILTRKAAANLRFGAADAAAPVAQTLSVQSVVAGTSNTAGANLTITGSQGTGTGAGGSIIFQVAPAGSTGTAQNALATALTIASSGTLSLTPQNVTTAALAITTSATQTQNAITATSNFQSVLAATTYNSTAGNDTEFVFNRARGTLASPLAVASGDLTGTFYFAGWDGVNQFKYTTAFGSVVDGGVTTNTVPQALYISTGTTGRNERIRFTSSGNIAIASASPVGWTSTGDSSGTIDLFLTRRGAANLRFGAADAAAPVAQTLSVQSVVAGTSNTAGANLTITGSQGTGTGAGGSIIFQVAPAGSSGTAQNALTNALTIADSTATDFGRISVNTSTVVLAATFVASGSDSSTSGAGMVGYQNPGAAISNNARLGYLLFGGTTAANSGYVRPAGVAAFSTEGWSGTAYGSRLAFYTTANTTTTRTERLGIEQNGLVSFGGSTSSFPALKRSTTILQVRLADDSAYAPVEASTVRTATAYTVATLPAAGTAGRKAYVTDALAPTFLGALTGGGTVVTPVFDNGTAWVAG